LLQDPGDAVSVCPWVAVPLIVGNDVLAGADTGAAATVAVVAEVAEAEPPESVAVTTTSIVLPTSEPCRT
jgi:hypothetical protein